MPSLVDEAKPLRQGMERQWTRCQTCSNIAYYDYIPHGLGNPIQTLPCSHGIAIPFDQAVHFISEQEARDDG